MKKIKFERPQLVNLTNIKGKSANGLCWNGSSAGQIPECTDGAGGASQSVCQPFGGGAFGAPLCIDGSSGGDITPGG